MWHAYDNKLPPGLVTKLQKLFTLFPLIISKVYWSDK